MMEWLGKMLGEREESVCGIEWYAPEGLSRKRGREEPRGEQVTRN